MIMTRAYEYLFYKLYQWSIKVNGKDDYHKASACMMVSFAIMLNLFTVPIVWYILTGWWIGLPDLPKLTIIAIAVVYLGLNYAYFSYDGRYLKILDRYRNEDTVSAKRGNMVVATYVIGSFVLLVASGFLGVYINDLRQGG